MDIFLLWTVIQFTWFAYIAVGLAFGVAFFVLCWNVARIRKILEKKDAKKD